MVGRIRSAHADACNLSPRFQNRTYAAFLFDMDGTMLDSSAVVERTWRAWANRHGINPDDLLESVHGVRSEDTIRRFGPVGIDVAKEAAWVLKAELSDVEGVVPIAGIKALVADLDPAAWAVVTSAPRALAALRIHSVGLPMPKTLIVAEDVKQGKPNPEGFLKAAARLGVPISECLIFEDSPAGVAAAKAAGAHVAIVGDLMPAGEGTLIISDYR
jgi:sugar-phosphatase